MNEDRPAHGRDDIFLIERFDGIDHFDTEFAFKIAENNDLAGNIALREMTLMRTRK
jgi:hypothetical protein